MTLYYETDKLQYLENEGETHTKLMDDPTSWSTL